MTSLIIFVKNPELGKVKTRLAASVGERKALEIYHQLLEHTLKTTSTLDVNKTVFYSEKVEFEDLWNKKNYTKKVQFGNHLGERMLNAFEEVFTREKGPVCIIGSDCFDITADIINQAYEGLKVNDLMVGPSQDGGYYLLGMNDFYPSLFKNIDWSTEIVRAQTLTIAKSLNLSVGLLPVLNDIDTIDDLKESGLNY